MADWQKGDLALAVASPKPCTFCGYFDERTMAGSLHTVSDYVCEHFDDGPVWVLHFVGIENAVVTSACFHKGFGVYRWRKVTPPKADQFDREVIDLMAGKKVPA